VGAGNGHRIGVGTSFKVAAYNIRENSESSVNMD
jgi:hypothetical protein